MTHRACTRIGAFFPNHVVFCGADVTALTLDDTSGAVGAGHGAAGLAPSVFMLVPGKGALIRSEASPGPQVLSGCVGVVLARFPSGASPGYLTGAHRAELLDWHAEKYRPALNAL